jgi:hypothetical protein
LALATLTGAAEAATYQLRVASKGVKAPPSALVAPTLSASALSFQPLMVGQASLPQTLVLTNPDSRPQAVSSIQISGSSAFQQSSNCGSTLAAGASCEIDVSVAPTSAGPLSGQLTATLASGAASATLTGSAEPGLVAPGFSASALTFSPSQVGVSAGSRTVTLKNNDSRSQPVSSILFNPANSAFTKTTTCGASLAPGATCDITVSFTPAVVGPAETQLTAALGSGSVSATVSGSGEAAYQYATLDLSTSTGSSKSLSGYTWQGTGAYIRTNMSSAKSFYFEVQVSNGYVDVGLTTGTTNAPFFELDMNGNLYVPSLAASYGAWGASKVGVAWNVDTRTASFYYDGVLKGSQTFSGIAGPVFPVLYSNGGTISANVGTTSFGTRLPAGYAAGVYK